MELSKNKFKQALKDGRRQVGIWSSLSHHTAVEILANAGFDWVLLDTEHSPNELPMVHMQLQATAGGTATPIVRPAWNDKVLVKRYLDVGAQTLLLPYVQNEEEARHAVVSTRYPPHGIRGFASASRASGYGRIKDYHRSAQKEICLLVQVETRTALSQINAIANVEGIDGVFIGPGDLSADMGHLGDTRHEEVWKAIEEAARDIRGAGKAAGILVAEADAQRCFDMGYLFVAVGSDVGLLARNADALAAKFHSL